MNKVQYPLHINVQIRTPICSAEQYLSIRSVQKQAPLLLYLHGGLGDAALPLGFKV